MLASRQGPLDDAPQAEDDLGRAALIDIGDWFQFVIGGGLPIGNDAVRLPVNAVIGATTWVEFHVDLVGADLHMRGDPEDVLPLARGVIPAVEQRGYRAYPLLDHVADKVVATYELHGRDRRPSTRYRDLVDLVAIVTGASVPGNAQTTAIRSEFDRRGVVLPDHFDVPDRVLWEPGYAAEARRVASYGGTDSRRSPGRRASLFGSGARWYSGWVMGQRVARMGGPSGARSGRGW